MAKSLDGVITKKAHTREKFTEDQVVDLLACSDPADGYLHFSRNHFHIQHPVKGKMLFRPFDYQERLLHSYHDYRFNKVARPLVHQHTCYGLPCFTQIKLF